MTTLKRRKVGKTKLEVTELGLGGAPMGGLGAWALRASISRKVQPSASVVLGSPKPSVAR